jgi:hypothetical protein
MTETVRAPRRGPDRLSLALFSLTAFLLVLALLGTQIAPPKPPPAPPRPVIVRRIYVTTVVEKVPAGVAAAAPRSTVTQTSTPAPAPPAPVATRTSGTPAG